VNLYSTCGAKVLVRVEEERMLQHATIGDQIVEVVKANPGCTLEEIIHDFPGLHWSDVYLEVDRLTRSGRLRMIRDTKLSTTTFRLPSTV